MSTPPEKFVRYSSLFVFVSCALVLLGWHFDITFLKSVAPGLITIKVNTAIGIFFLALVNSFFSKDRRNQRPNLIDWGLLSFTLLPFLIAVLTLAEYRFQLSLPLDELFYIDTGATQGGKFPPGRLAPITATLFILLSVAQVLSFNPVKRFYRMAQGFTLLVLVIALQSFISYLLGTTHSFGVAFYTQIALPTTILITLVALGLLATRPDRGWLQIIRAPTSAGQSTRRLLIWAIVVPPLVHWFEVTGEHLGLYNSDFSGVIRISGNMLFFVWVILKNAQQLHRSGIASKETEDKFRSVTELSPQIIWTANPDGFVDYYNEKWFAYTGLSLEQTHAWGWEAVLHPDDFVKTMQRWRESYLSGEPYEFEYRFKRASDGTYRWHLGRAVPLKNSEGQIEKWFGTCTDIDDQKLAEKEKSRVEAEKAASESIWLSEVKLRAIFDSAFDAIVGFDPDGLITDWNPRAERMFGISRRDALGTRLEKLISLDSVSDFLKEALNETIETEGIRQTGGRFPMQISITSIELSAGKIFTAFISDITERKRNEKELVSARHAAIAAAQAKSAFLANMSHEIRTPLNGIIGMTDLLLETSLNELQKKYAKIVQDSGSGLLTIINDILDFSKIDAGKLSLELLEFSPVTLIESQAELLAAKALQKDLSLVTFVDPALPSMLRGDPGRVGQVLLNLIANAIKFTERGSIRVSARPAQKNGVNLWVLFQVEDTGIGLTSEQCDRLFKPFVQADGSTARKYGGTGLGLSICKQLVELMGGTIQIKSVSGQGSTVSFELPLAEAEVEACDLDHQPRSVPLDRLRILVVDDDAISREVLSGYLNAWKMQVSECANAEKAISRMREASAAGVGFDVVILDQRMPGLDGVSLARMIKQDPSLHEVPLILTTAFDRKHQSDTALDEGFSSYLTKPLRQSTLYDAIVESLLRTKTNAAVLPAAPPEVFSLPQSNLRILVAEDNTVNQLLTLTQLKKLGYAAHAVANGREVIEALAQAPYDLILMDCQMPEMDGFEATRLIREQERIQNKPRVPIVALTANVMKEDQEACLNAGMDDFVGKPTKKEILGKALARWLTASAS